MKPIKIPEAAFDFAGFEVAIINCFDARSCVKVERNDTAYYAPTEKGWNLIVSTPRPGNPRRNSY